MILECLSCCFAGCFVLIGWVLVYCSFLFGFALCDCFVRGLVGFNCFCFDVC